MTKTPKTTRTFWAAAPIYSRQHRQHFKPGETIEFDLSEEAENKPDIELLLSMGVLSGLPPAQQDDEPVGPDEPQIGLSFEEQ